MPKNIEFKARCDDISRVRDILLNGQADYNGFDHQRDVYFNVSNGRLKLRKGNIENNLIGYEREDISGSKLSKVNLFRTEPESSLEEVLTNALGVKVVVDKNREIYFIDNVKFHLDEVKDLGNFIEVEAIDVNGDIGLERLQEQCDYYFHLLKIDSSDLVSESYGDLILRK